jgi:hypothetical protein
MIRQIILPFYFLILLLFLQAPSYGQDDGSIPTLNNHRFINNFIVEDPFTKSTLRYNMGVGSSSKIELPSTDIGDSTSEPTIGNLLYSSLNFQVDLRLKEWVSYVLRIGASARVGLQPQTIFTNGLNAVLGVSNSWKFRLYQNEKHQLSTSARINSYTVSVTDVAAFVDDIIGEDSSQNASEVLEVLQAGIGVHYAYAPGSVIGLQTTAKFKYGDLFETGKSGGSFTISGAMDINLFPKTNIPLGLSLGYGYTSIPDFSVAQYNNTSIFNAKLAYTGSKNVIVSVDGTTFTGPYNSGPKAQEEESDIRVLNLSLNVIIYFN